MTKKNHIYLKLGYTVDLRKFVFCQLRNPRVLHYHEKQFGPILSNISCGYVLNIYTYMFI